MKAGDEEQLARMRRAEKPVRLAAEAGAHVVGRFVLAAEHVRLAVVHVHEPVEDDHRRVLAGRGVGPPKAGKARRA